jgi:hypothetical protein
LGGEAAQQTHKGPIYHSEKRDYYLFMACKSPINNQKDLFKKGRESRIRAIIIRNWQIST